MNIFVIGVRGFPTVQGGIEYHCEHLYTHLANLGLNVTVFVRKPYVNPQVNSYKGVSLIPIDCPRSKYFENIIYSFRSFLKARRFKPNILHIHSSFFLAPLARALGMKVVLTLHCQSYKHKKWGIFSKLFLIFNEVVGVLFANSVIAISIPIATSLEKQYHKRVVYVPNGVTIPLECDREHQLSKPEIRKHKYILFVGRFAAGKGVEDLIDAFNYGNIEGWKLVIVGEADHESAYSRGLKEKARKNSNIILTGYLTGSALDELYSNAGLFVLPSYYEGLPIALLEAMSYGLSCIASDIPANRSVGLQDNRLFKAGDIKLLRDKIKEFISKPMIKEEREKQRKMVIENNSWNKIADKTLQVYNQVMSTI